MSDTNMNAALVVATFKATSNLYAALVAYGHRRPPKFDSDFKHRWAEALESGEYVQGNVYLALPTYLEADGSGGYPVARKNPVWAFCCLGVACVVMGQKPEDISSLNSDDDDLRSSSPKWPMSPWDRRQSDDKRIGEARLAVQTFFAALNDAGVPFPTIATILRENF